jgi:hypothetical protein
MLLRPVGSWNRKEYGLAISFTAITVVGLTLLIHHSLRAQRANQALAESLRKGERGAFRPTQVLRGERPPAIVDAPVIPAGKVTDQVTGKELVLGVVVNDQARAYPLNMLTGPSREIVNDQLGGRAIAATW